MTKYTMDVVEYGYASRTVAYTFESDDAEVAIERFRTGTWAYIDVDIIDETFEPTKATILSVVRHGNET